MGGDPVRVFEDDHWTMSAKCKGLDETGDLFFPVAYGPAHKQQIREAKSYCRACPVRDACMEDALSMEYRKGLDSRAGIRGGMTPKERWTEDRRRRQEASTT